MSLCPRCHKNLKLVYLCSDCFDSFGKSKMYEPWFNYEVTESKNKEFAAKILKMWCEGEFDE
jgi:hypothetical protein